MPKFDFVRQMIEIAAAEAACSAQPKERCGVIVQDGETQRLIECENVSLNPQENFVISAENWAYVNVDYEVLASL